MTRMLEVWGDRDFTVSVPDDARVTFGPFSPPAAGAGWKGGSGSGLSRGTLRIYKGAKTTENVMAVFSGVEGFRDLSLGYAEAPKVTALKSPRAPLLDWASMSSSDQEDFAEMVASAMRSQAIEKTLEEDGEKEDEKMAF